MTLPQAFRMAGIMVLATWLGSAEILAHQITLMGTVLAVQPAKVQVKTIDDKTKKEDIVWFAVDKNTTVKRGDKRVTYPAAKIIKGERIVITVDHDAKIKMLATEIRLPAAK